MKKIIIGILICFSFFIANGENLFSSQDVECPTVIEIKESTSISKKIANKLNEVEICKLHPIISVSISPDSLNMYNAAINKEQIGIWSQTDSTQYIWNLTGKQIGFDGSYNRIRNHPELFNTNISEKIYAVNLFPKEKYYYPYFYIKTAEKGWRLFDLQHNEYANINELVLSKFGSFEIYRLLYDMSEIHNKLLITHFKNKQSNKFYVGYIIDYDTKGKFILFWDTDNREVKLMSLKEFHSQYLVGYE